MKTFEQYNKKEYKGIPLMNYINHVLGKEYFILSINSIELIPEPDKNPNLWVASCFIDDFNPEIMKDWIIDGIDALDKDNPKYPFQVDRNKKRKILYKNILDILNDEDSMATYIDSEEIGLI